MTTLVERHLYVTWRRPEGLMVPVGRLTQVSTSDGPVYRFVYLKGAERETEFQALPGLPELYRRYESAALFPVFANRVMPRDRRDFPELLDQLDLAATADPFEVLGRSEGIRATDRVEVFPGAFRLPDGQLSTVFFLRGIRHLDGAAAAVEHLQAGDLLVMQAQPDNEGNPMAVLLCTRTGEQVGWVPDYLLDLIADLEHLNGQAPTITVEHVNPPSVAPHLRVLCRAAARWPDGLVPFSGPDFQLLA
jgi:hypothetical protein